MRDKALVTVAEAVELLSLSRTQVYTEMARGRLRSVHVGRARRVPARAIAEYVELLESEARDDAANEHQHQSRF